MALESRPLKDWLLVPVEAEPAQAVEDDAGVLVRGAFLVGVFDAEQELAARVAGEQPVEEGGAGAADVEVARGRRGEADAGGDWRCQVSGVRCQVSVRRGGDSNPR